MSAGKSFSRVSNHFHAGAFTLAWRASALSPKSRFLKTLPIEKSGFFLAEIFGASKINGNGVEILIC